MRRIERVMLIYPPVSFSPQTMKQSHVPLGLGYIAAMLKDKVELSVLDAAVLGYRHEERIAENLLRYGLSMEEIAKRVEAFKPDLVGMSCIFSSQFRNVAELCEVIKKIDPEIITITGGTHPSFLPELCLDRAPALDTIALGEGEMTMLDVVKAGRGEMDWSEVKSLAHRANGKVKINERREPIQDLDSLPFPARDLFPLELYHEIGEPMGIVYKRRPFMNLISSRGCPYRCTFCSSTNFWGNQYRKRSAENVLDEMEHLHKDLGIREFKFFDDNLTSDKERAKKIFQGMIDREIDVKWNTPNGIHAVSLDREMLALMKKSGCYELTLAVESGDPEVLKNIIRKPTRLEQVEKSAALLREMGIGSYGFFIIGFPGETKEQIHNTLEFSKTLDLDRISCFIFNPLPGTLLFDECVEKGYVKLSEIAEDVDYFEPRFDTPEWTREDIQKIRSRWFWSYNFGLLVRHPVRFFSRYSSFLGNPRLVWEVVKRRIRAVHPGFLTVKRRK